MNKSETDMPYTDFRKSYGDFEVIIPAVDFGQLTHKSAMDTIKALRAYENGFVCVHLNGNDQTDACKCIGKMLTRMNHNILGAFVRESFKEREKDESIPFFGTTNQAGITIRKAWCEHMANEIEREFGLTL